MEIEDLELFEFLFTFYTENLSDENKKYIRDKIYAKPIDRILIPSFEIITKESKGLESNLNLITITIRCHYELLTDNVFM